MRIAGASLLLFVLMLGGGGCAATVPLSGNDPLETSVFIVNHGWHTGLVLPLDVSFDHGERVLDQLSDGGAWLEFSWGDEDFFRSDGFSLLLALKAALIPTDSVVHVVSFTESVTDFFPSAAIVRLEVTADQYRVISDYLGDSFQVNREGKLIRIGDGLYGKSGFFQGRQKYFLPRTCNVWVAKALEKAGFPVSPVSSMRADGLMEQVERLGSRER